MKIPKAFTPTSAAVLLLLSKRPTPASAAAWEAGADDDTMSEQRRVPSGTTNASFATVDSMWAGAAPTSSATTTTTTTTTTTQPHGLDLADVHVWGPEAQATFQGFSEAHHRWYTPLKQVSAEPTPTDRNDDDDPYGSRWTRFRWWEASTSATTPPDPIILQSRNALLYVAHTITAYNISVLLYGSPHHRRHRRYRRFNPNSKRNRRYRRMMRASADISRVLRGFWPQPWAAGSASSGEKWQARNKTTESSCSIRLCPVGPVVSVGPAGLSPWRQIAAPATSALPLASPPALLTPFEMSTALVPSSHHLVQVADAHINSYPHGISMASLHRTSDEIMVTIVPALLGFTTTWRSLWQSFIMTVEVGQSAGIMPAGGVTPATLGVTTTWLTLRQSYTMTTEVGQSAGIVPVGGVFPARLGVTTTWLRLLRSFIMTTEVGQSAGIVPAGGIFPATLGVTTTWLGLWQSFTMTAEVDQSTGIVSAGGVISATLGVTTTWLSLWQSFTMTAEVGQSAGIVPAGGVIPATLGVTTTWMRLWKSFTMTAEVDQSAGIVPAGGRNGVVRTGVVGLSVACPTERVNVTLRWILVGGVELYASAGRGKVLCVQTRSYTTGAIVTNSVGQFDRHSSDTSLACRLKGNRQASVPSLVLTAAARRPRLRPRPPAAALGVTIPSEALGGLVAPLLPGLRGFVAPQHRASDAAMAARVDSTAWSFHPQRSLVVMDSWRRFLNRVVTPEYDWNGTIRRRFCRWSAACRVEKVDVCWTLVKTVDLLPLKTGYARVLCTQGRLYSATGEIATSFEGRDGRQDPTTLSFYCRPKMHVETAIIVPSLPSPPPPPLPAAPWPPLCVNPPVSPLETAYTIPLELPVAPCPPALSRATSLSEASNAAITAALDVATWSSLARTFVVVDLCEADSVRPEGGWDGAIQTDVDRLSVAYPAERADVRWILSKAAELYPNTGYAQGSDYAAFAIYRGMGGDKEATVRVFVQWASPTTWFQSSTINGEHAQLQMGMCYSWKVIQLCSPGVRAWLHSKANASLMLRELTGDDAMMALYASIFMTGVCSLCTRLGLRGHIVHTIISKTLEAGTSGPAVSLWVVHCLLGIAEAECNRMDDANEDVCIQARLYTASKTITSYDDLDRHAPMALSPFVRGYRAAMSSLPLPAAPLPPLCSFPPAAALEEALIPLEPPVAPWPSAALPRIPPQAASDAATATSLDAATWLHLAGSFAVVDLGESDSVMPGGGWVSAIETDVDRLSVAFPTERVDVRWILEMAAELYPNTGYAQGADYAALAICRGMGRNKEATLPVFVKWASPTTWFQSSTINGQPVQLQNGMRHSQKVLQTRSPSVHAWLHSEANASLMLSELTGDDALIALYASVFMTAVCSLCTRQGLPGYVVSDIIQRTLEAENSGPAVSLWVVHCLLRIVEADCKRSKDFNADTCIQARLFTAGHNVTSFDELDRHAPMTLGCFIQGYRAAVVPVNF